MLVLVPPPAQGARVDAELVQGLRHPGVLAQEEVAVEVEVPHQGDLRPLIQEPPLDLGHGLRRLLVVHGEAHDLASRPVELQDLGGGGLHVPGGGVGHGLHGDGVGAP